MNVQVEHLENHIARLTVLFDAQTVQSERQNAAKRLAKQVRIPGFRPGKAPYKVVQRMIGDAAILEETLDKLVDKNYGKALDESDIDPVAPGNLKDFKLEDSGDLTVIFEVAKAPTVDLKDYRSLRAELVVEDVTEENVDKTLASMRDERAVVEDVEREAQIDDQVELELDVKFFHAEAHDHDHDHEDDDDDDHDEEAEEDAASETEEDDDHDEEDHDHDHGHFHDVINQEDFKMVVRADGSEEDIFPGFSQHLIGLKVDDEKEFSLELPEDFDDEMMAGSPIEVKLKVVAVRSRILPELDDLFAQQMLNDAEKTLLDLRNGVREDLENAAKQTAEGKLFEETFDQILEQADILYPDVMVDSYVESMYRRMEDIVQKQANMKMTDYLRIMGMDEASWREEQREPSIERLERDLVMQEFVEQEQLYLQDGFVDREVDRVAASFGEQASLYRQLIDTPQYRSEIANTLMTNRLVKRMVDIVTGQEPPVGPDPEPEIEEVEEEVPANQIVLEGGASSPLPQAQDATEAEPVAEETAEDTESEAPEDDNTE